VQAWITSSSPLPGLAPIICGVPKPYTPTTYRKAFLARVRAARTVANREPIDVAAKLGIPKDTYLRYESRTLLPHHLVLPFCLYTGADPTWLVTGERFRVDADGNAVPARSLA